MLTPYQFASNTPIQAIDLDGLEAFYVQYGFRGSVPLLANGLGVTASYNIGVAFDLDKNIGVYQTLSLGGQQGIGLTLGGSGGINWQVNNIQDMEGLGVNVGGFIGGPPGVSLPFEASAELTLNPKAEKVSDLLSGFNFGIPSIPGITYDASIYGEGAYTNFSGITNLGDDYLEFSKSFNKMINDFELNLDHKLKNINLDSKKIGFDSKNFSNQIYNLLYEANLVPEIDLPEVIVRPEK
ncbi:hypothetical protein GCM10007049_30860 [Echinicola pacifica]|uniref:Uncharacterized protein n=1 Tax=Echinicola pacifica TaxID=346377 RepID=A0A918Q5Y8_9BACT|nr:hypothetical protein [Echinicola pacifica]GGZ35264.1 hypothetical protein GCM10007049_30860 [Echinicola pacifica]